MSSTTLTPRVIENLTTKFTELKQEEETQKPRENAGALSSKGCKRKQLSEVSEVSEVAEGDKKLTLLLKHEKASR